LGKKLCVPKKKVFNKQCLKTKTGIMQIGSKGREIDATMKVVSGEKESRTSSEGNSPRIN